ncbi:unnamed protein product [Phytophthora fragariaefolia]|uniref:Unnamed protein product n=1 Tax=Phytophthora fragariaefolia TaxID=1490495 RepID=A0A9W6YF92_9STRA|nr:unnamed protein product [Phytophthora fragariaefolia]
MQNEIGLKKFWENGYMVLRQRVAVDAAQGALECMSCIAAPELDPVTSTDVAHVQTPLKDGPGIMEFMHASKAVTKKFHMRWMPQRWVFVQSEQGAAEQEPRYEFPLPEITDARMKYPLTIQAVMLVGHVPDARILKNSADQHMRRKHSEELLQWRLESGYHELVLVVLRFECQAFANSDCLVFITKSGATQLRHIDKHFNGDTLIHFNPA